MQSQAWDDKGKGSYNLELSSLVVCAAANANVTIQSVQKTAETAALETIASMQVPNPLDACPFWTHVKLRGCTKTPDC